VGSPRELQDVSRGCRRDKQRPDACPVCRPAQVVGDRQGERRQSGREDGCVVDETFQEGSGEAGCHGRRLADVVRSARVAVAQSTTGILRC
jgi:hypothetical protein